MERTEKKQQHLFLFYLKLLTSLNISTSHSCNAWGRFEQQLFQNNRADYHYDSHFGFNHLMQHTHKKKKKIKKEMKTQTNDSCWLISCLFASIALLYFQLFCIFGLHHSALDSNKEAVASSYTKQYASQFYTKLIPTRKK